MKKIYSKPTIAVMKLRPEEKIALCEWPVGFFSSGGLCSQTWAEVSAYSDMCTGLYNNAEAGGS